MFEMNKFLAQHLILRDLCAGGRKLLEIADSHRALRGVVAISWCDLASHRFLTRRGCLGSA